MTENEALYILNNYKFDMRQNGAFDMITTISVVTNALKELQHYRKIGTVEECREAVEKQKPKIPIFEHMLGEWTGKFRCPICKKVVAHDCRDTKNTFCKNCGQAIQWDENLEGMEE